MEDLDLNEKLALAHFYQAGVLNNEERKTKVNELLKKFTYGQLSLLLKIPKTTLFNWANPESKAGYYYNEMAETDDKTEIINSIEKEVKKKFIHNTYQGKDNTEFRKMAAVNTKLKTALDLLRDIIKVENKIGEAILKKIKVEVQRLNGKWMVFGLGGVTDVAK